MLWIRRSLATLAALCALTPSVALATFGAPFQSPRPSGSGQLSLVPSLGLIDEGFVESMVFGLRGRYGLSEDAGAGLRIAGLVGDIDQLQVGAEGSFRFLRAGSSPVEMSVFGTLDFGFIDYTSLNVQVGALLGVPIKADSLVIEPYVGLAAGVDALLSRNGPTDPMLGIVLGSQVDINPGFGILAELEIRLLDGAPTVIFQVGAPIRF